MSGFLDPSNLISFYFFLTWVQFGQSDFFHPFIYSFIFFFFFHSYIQLPSTSFLPIFVAVSTMYVPCAHNSRATQNQKHACILQSIQRRPPTPSTQVCNVCCNSWTVRSHLCLGFIATLLPHSLSILNFMQSSWQPPSSPSSPSSPFSSFWTLNTRRIFDSD